MKSYDLIVIGVGPGGHVAAIRAAQLGLNVACIEREKDIGGTCLRIGCIPSKALLESSEHYALAKRGLSEHGVELAGVELDLPALMKRKDRIVSTLIKGLEALFKKNRITRYFGHGKLAGANRVVVESESGTEQLGSHTHPPSIRMDGKSPDRCHITASLTAFSD